MLCNQTLVYMNMSDEEILMLVGGIVLLVLVLAVYGRHLIKTLNRLQGGAR